MANDFKLDFSEAPTFAPLDQGPDGRISSPSGLGAEPDGEISNALLFGTANMESGIQLDEVGMAEQWYASIAGIRAFEKEMLGKGIDVSQGFDFRNPEARKAHTLFQTAIAHHNRLTEILTQGARNLQEFRKREGMGQSIGSPDLYGQIATDRNIHENTFSTNLDDINAYNKVLDRVPTNKAEEQELLAYREQAIQEIMARTRYAGKPEDYRRFLESHLAIPRRYDATEDNLKSAQTARQWQQYRSQKEQESFIDPRIGVLTDDYRKWKSSPQSFPLKDQVFTSSSLRGAGYKGKSDFILERIDIYNDGSGTAIYKASPLVQVNETKETFTGQDGEEKSFAGSRGEKFSDGELVVSFDESNVANLLSSMMTEDQYTKAMLNAKRAGALRGGRISMMGFEKLIGANMEETQMPGSEKAMLPGSTGLDLGKAMLPESTRLDLGKPMLPGSTGLILRKGMLPESTRLDLRKHTSPKTGTTKKATSSGRKKLSFGMKERK